jgi:hypothetical protein
MGFALNKSYSQRSFTPSKRRKSDKTCVKEVYSHFTYSWSLEALEVGYLKASKKASSGAFFFSRIL